MSKEIQRRIARPLPEERSELRGVVDVLLKAPAVSAESLGPAVPPQIERYRGNSAVSPGIGHVRIALSVLAVAVQYADDRDQSPIGKRRTIIEFGVARTPAPKDSFGMADDHALAVYHFFVRPMRFMEKLVAVPLACAGAATVAAPAPMTEPCALHATGLATKKGPALDTAIEAPPVLATLAQSHTGEHVVLDEESPSQQRFAALLSDRVTGQEHSLDERLLGLLRGLAALHRGAQIEIVSGYRSWKTNEALRKKGHHVSAHSQHSAGNACDFRLVPEGAERALDPRAVEREIRGLGWSGGIGVYLAKDDWFVHADVGRNRRWEN